MGGSENFTCRPTSLAHRRAFSREPASQHRLSLREPTLTHTLRSATRHTPPAEIAKRASASAWATTPSSSSNPAPLKYSPHRAPLRPSPPLPQPLLLRPLRSHILTFLKATHLPHRTTHLRPATAPAHLRLVPIHPTNSVPLLTQRLQALTPPLKCRSLRLRMIPPRACT